MTRRSLSSLGKMVRDHRGDHKLRECAAEIGISPATLMRIEGGRLPDIGTFGKICQWLKIDPGDFLGFDNTESEHKGEIEDPISITAHYKAGPTMNPDTANALGKMLTYAARIQPLKRRGEDDGDF